MLTVRGEGWRKPMPGDDGNRNSKFCRKNARHKRWMYVCYRVMLVLHIRPRRLMETLLRHVLLS